jgi:predicted nucleotidyltransferase
VRTQLPDGVERFLASLVAFAEARDDVRAVALVGSHARGAARPDSDVDVVMLSTQPEMYLDDCDWIDRFPGATLLATRRWGALTERRLVLVDETEVDFGVARTSWASIRPLDPGTARVARDGLIVLHDPDGLLADVAAAAT